MGETLTQRRRVRDEGLRVVNRNRQGRRKGRYLLKAPAKYVPAAAVIRMVQALFGITGRKERAGG